MHSPTVRNTPALGPGARRVLERRYLRRDDEGRPAESPADMFRRVAANVSRAELAHGADEAERKHWEDAFYAMMTEMRFLPNSPTLMNAGTDIQQLSACFVLPVEDSMEGIFDAIKHTALIHKSGGGTGFSFSRIRPSNDVVNSTRGVSSGPLSFMSVFDAATETVKQGGRRRGANMAVLRVDHPDILDFIQVKDRTDRLNNFNISVALTDRFMQALADNESYELINPRDGSTTGSLEAGMVFDKLVDSAWKTGEPGIVFIDRINAENPTPGLGPIESTNPCGEQPLLPYESCNLGSVNLPHFVRGVPGEGEIDFEALDDTVRVAVRFLDDVIEMNRYPLPQIAEITRANRKIGLGVMGFADMLIRMGIAYDDSDAVVMAGEVMRRIQEVAREASAELARERGAFANFGHSVYAQRGEGPLRNATTTTIAPTGSISMIADVSSGIEPLFAVAFTRRVLDGEEFVEVNSTFEEIARREGFYSRQLVERIANNGGVQSIEEIPKRWRQLFKTAHEVPVSAHVRIQAAFQKYTDNAVSKTLNFANEATREDVRHAFEEAYELGCKGVTIYRDGSRDHQVLSAGPAQAASTGAATRAPSPRPDLVVGETQRVGTGCGKLYVTINAGDSGRPFELFAQIGKAGGCAASQTEAIGRLVSLALRSGIDPAVVARQLRGVRCPSPAWNRGQKVFSCADGISQALGAYIDRHADGTTGETATSMAERLAGVCAECGNILEYEGGCVVCRGCGYSRC